MEPTRTASFGAHRRPIRLVATLVVGLLAGTLASLAVGGPANAAGPATITANPNPAVVEWGEKTGFFELAWDTGDPDIGAEVTFEVDNNGESPRYPFEAKGKIDPTAIEYGTTQVWRLYAKGGARALDSVEVTTRRPDTSCLEGCLVDFDITPHGTFVDVDVTTVNPVKLLELTAHRKNGPLEGAILGVGTDHWQTQMFDLDPGVQYTFDLTLTDESGNKQSTSIVVSTLKRMVTVDFDIIEIIDDSDDLSEGDLRFWFHNDSWDNSIYGEVVLDTGDSVDPGHTMTSFGSPDKLVIGLHGNDDDCDFFDGLCSEGTGPSSDDVGSSAQRDWATAWTTVNTLVSGPNESFNAKFSLETTGGALEFKGFGTYTVTYV